LNDLHIDAVLLILIVHFGASAAGETGWVDNSKLWSRLFTLTLDDDYDECMFSSRPSSLRFSKISPTLWRMQNFFMNRMAKQLQKIKS
jgi:hypothetical protein